MDDSDYREFAEAMAEVLDNPSVDRRRLSKARAKVDQNDPRYADALCRAHSDKRHLIDLRRGSFK